MQPEGEQLAGRARQEAVDLLIGDGVARHLRQARTAAQWQQLDTHDLSGPWKFARATPGSA